MANAIQKSIKSGASALLWGVGNSGDYFNWGAANKNLIELRGLANAASGDSRLIYAQLKLGGAGSGEALRAYARAAAAGVATGGTVNGLHASLALDVSASVSGQGFASRHTLDAAADTRTISGNLAAILAETNIAAGNTVPATVALIHLKEIGAVACKTAFRFPSTATGGMLAPHVTDAMTHSVRCVSDAGVVYYLMATTTATNRTNA